MHAQIHSCIRLFEDELKAAIKVLFLPQIQDVAGAVRNMKEVQQVRSHPKRKVYRCPECSAEVQDFRRHFGRHYPRTSAEVNSFISNIAAFYQIKSIRSGTNLCF